MIYRMPSIVALTTGLAAGGGASGGSVFAPPGAQPVDLPVDRRPVSVLAAGSITITWPAVPADKTGGVVAVGVSASDFNNVRTTTRVNGVSLPPLQLTLGAVGSLENPTYFAAPLGLIAGDVFSLLIENIGAVAQDMAGRTIGYTDA